MLCFPKVPVLFTSAIAAALTLHGAVRAQNPTPVASNVGSAQTATPIAAPYYGTVGAVPNAPFLPPLPVVPVAPLFVPPGLPVLAPPSLPQPWFAPLPLLDTTRQPVDEGTLKTQEREITDAQGTRLRIRERTWKSAGIPCHELTVLQPATEVPAEQPTAVPVVEPAAPAPTTTPATAEPANTAPAAATKPELAPIADAAAPLPGPADKVPDRTPPTMTQPQTAQPTPASIPAVAAPATEGVKVHRVQRAGMKGIYSSIQVPPGERNLLGIGASTDSTNGTRLYRYYQGPPATEPRDTKAQ